MSDAPDEKMPSLPPPNGQHTSALMNRLQAFLPKIEAANQALPTENVPRVDLDLKSDNDDDDGSKSADDEEKEGALFAKEESSESAANNQEPTIQIEFALGDMSGNPMMKLLTNEDDGDSSNDDGDNEDNTPESSKEKAVTKLLSESSSSAKPAKGKSLITEM